MPSTLKKKPINMALFCAHNPTDPRCLAMREVNVPNAGGGGGGFARENAVRERQPIQMVNPQVSNQVIVPPTLSFGGERPPTMEGGAPPTYTGGEGAFPPTMEGGLSTITSGPMERRGTVFGSDMIRSPPRRMVMEGERIVPAPASTMDISTMPSDARASDIWERSFPQLAPRSSTVPTSIGEASQWGRLTMGSGSRLGWVPNSQTSAPTAETVGMSTATTVEREFPGVALSNRPRMIEPPIVPRSLTRSSQGTTDSDLIARVLGRKHSTLRDPYGEMDRTTSQFLSQMKDAETGLPPSVSLSSRAYSMPSLTNITSTSMATEASAMPTMSSTVAEAEATSGAVEATSEGLTLAEVAML